jgi:RHS repeat-associated protein
VPAIIITAKARDAAGNVTIATAGSALTSVRTFDDWGFLKHTRTQSAAGAVTDEHDFSYDKDGILNERDDLTPGASPVGPLVEKFEHDSLHRLVGWTAPGNSIGYDYDDFGNMVARTDASSIVGETWTPSVNRTPHQIASANDGGTYEYDDRGNLTRTGDWTASYASRGLPKSMDFTHALDGRTCSGKACPHSDFSYDIFGHRVRKHLFSSGNDSETLTIGDLYERRRQTTGSGMLQTVRGGNVYHVQGLGGISAEVFEAVTWTPSQSGEVTYRVADHLGSPTLQVDVNGKVLGRQKFDPFGRRIVWNDVRTTAPTSTPPVIPGFTSQAPDDDIGLVNMHGRLYDPKRARFISPDLVMGNPLNTQRWNRYSYVMNSPLALVDPSGFSPDASDASSETTDEDVRILEPIVEVVSLCEANPASCSSTTAEVDEATTSATPGSPESAQREVVRGSEDWLERASKGATGFFFGLGEAVTPLYLPIFSPSDDANFATGRGWGTLFGGGVNIISGVFESGGGGVVAGIGFGSAPVDGPIGVGVGIVGVAIAIDGRRRIVQGIVDVGIGMTEVWMAGRKEPHRATYELKGPDGSVKSAGKSVSGGTSPGRRLTWPEQGKLHTEVKILDETLGKTSPGDVIVIQGTRPPCGMCQRAMRAAAAEREITITYIDGAGKEWVTGPVSVEAQ